MKRLAILVIAVSTALCLFIKTGDDVTISGISSGAFMCMQMHIANSEIIRGAGIFGGGPYHCAKGSLNNLLQKSAVDSDSNSEENCEMELLMEEQQKSLMNWMADGSEINLIEIKQIIKNYEKQGKIDSTSNLIGNKVYIFSGTSDDLVVSKVLIKNNFFTL